MMGWIDTKRPPTFSVDGLTHGMGFSDFARERSAPADCFRCKVRWDSCYGSAREALPCTERSDAKQPGHLTVQAVCLAERTYSRQESIEVRPLFQRDISSYSRIVMFNAFSYIPIQTYPISCQYMQKSQMEYLQKSYEPNPQNQFYQRAYTLFVLCISGQ